MPRSFKVFGLWLIVTALAAPALAVPAPMSEQELAEKSDIIALVRVLSVTCTSVATDKETGEELPKLSRPAADRRAEEGQCRGGR